MSETPKIHVDVVRQLLAGMGEDPLRPGLRDTPQRVSRMYEELLQGHKGSPPKITTFPAEEGVDFDQIVVVSDIDFWSLCVPSNQHVNAVDGSKRASQVQVGDRLWTLRYGRTVQTQVKRVVSRKTHRLVKVTTTEGEFCVTPDHPFATPEGWVEAADLLGMSIEWTNPKSLCRRRFPPKIGYPFGYALGAVFSDGTVGDRCISLVVNEEWFASRYATALEEAFGVEVELEPVSRPSGFTGEETPGFRVRIVSSYLADLFRMYAGGDANHMRQMFPRVVLQNRETMQGFIDGYVDGDGSRRKDRQASVIVSGNEEFLRDMAEAISANFTPSKDKAHKLYVSDHWHREGWFKKHGFRREGHRTTLNESCWVRVLSVEHLRAEKKPFTVYSFQCSHEPTFLIQGHLSHNCEHHMLPFFGKMHVGYIPGESKQVVGLSKIPRVVDFFSRRLQLQERLTAQVAEFLKEKLKAQGVVAIAQARHMCMEMRGVRKVGAMTTTSALRGDIPEEKFFTLLRSQR